MTERSTELDQLVARAAQARAEADAAILDNVRERCLRAEAAWLEMADRVRRVASMRRDHEEEKATRPPYLVGRRNAGSGA